ncbi:TrmH family RNA methyltransferase [Kangiella sediminilitoris]|uniref:TrmH family tRNA/rRNA methyltransferase n=1 Tax=Kangiella sediminilitoris TaxID=1144748 RepID=A0A1B3BCK5_9GAMM|nr:TrmH family RNA methyltransferase [Kangiella sediminilitoris]AOE50477.1 TrmH family tRNA/rRNA methyltransferase [Kangiella sediminilitoris]
MSDNRQLEHHDHLGGNNKHPIRILVHDITVPMNVGSIFRISDALGVEKIYLSGNTPIPPNNKIRKTSRSTEKYVDYKTFVNPVELIEELKEDNYTIVALEITSDSIPIQELKLEKDTKICLILGSENSGVSEDLLSLADITTHIPMLGRNSSMNVATACGIAVYSFTFNQ